MAKIATMVTGSMLREAMKRWNIRLEAAVKQFDGSLQCFPGETPEVTPVSLAESIDRAEKAIARLQVVQAKYNLGVTVKVNGEVITLTEAVKRVGGAGRLEKLWKQAAFAEPDPYTRRVNVRNSDQVVALKIISIQEAVQRAVDATQVAEALRAAINRGNQQEVNLLVETEDFT